MIEDRQLLRRYVQGSEAAFGELVQRHVGLVYSTALRRVGGDAHLAQDVAQMVFTELARRARWLPGAVVLAGWLHRATCFIAAQAVRTERRRRDREEKSVAMNPPDCVPTPQWESLRPLLDEALEGLGTADRDALLLRFFQERSLAEVGQALGASEEAARKRVDRALEKLRQHLARKGITATSGALAAVLVANAASSAPAGLAPLLATGALSAAVSTTGFTLLLLRFMALTKIQTAAACVLVAAAPIVLQWHALSTTRAAGPALRTQLAELEQQSAAQRRVLSQTERRSRYAETALARTRADIDAHLARIRAAGTPEDPGLYLWAENSEYVRLPKRFAKALTLSESVEVPVAGGTRRFQLPPVSKDGSLAAAMTESLGITDSEQAQVRQAFTNLNQAYEALLQQHGYLTNTPPPGLGLANQEARTWVTPAFAQAGEPLKEQLRQSLDAALGPERTELVWQQAEKLFREEFNDFGARTRYQVVAFNSNTSISYWDVSRLPSDTSFSTWLNTSGNLNPGMVAEPLRGFVADWKQAAHQRDHP